MDTALIIRSSKLETVLCRESRWTIYSRFVTGESEKYSSAIHYITTTKIVFAMLDTTKEACNLDGQNTHTHTH